ncbi:hypothetical protein [Sphingomonas asaccharolytica]|uniref:hypothetical protein n=1 Tax=Sphingomonas asaccharolytica TaxID=40681 RepID=UPI0008372993|nr:hypothetical protein [Sphingomonas asaccharolytica]
MDQDNDGWSDVTDPREIKKLTGVKGVQSMQKQAQGGPASAQAGDVDTPVKPPTGQGAQAAFAKVAAARTMLKQLNRVRSMYDKNMTATGLAGLQDYNPFRQENQEFDGAVAAIPLLARQAFRVAGSGADSDRELKLITDSLPNRWGFIATNRERFKSLDNVLRGFITSYGPLAGYSGDQIKRFSTSDTYGAPMPQAPPVRRAPPPAAAGWKITRK